MRRCYFLLFGGFFAFPLFLPAQNPFPAPGVVFRDDILPRIDIFIPADSLALLLAPGNEFSNYHWHATFVFDDGEWRDTVENIGFRLRGNTSRTSAKKSFKVSFNTYEPGRHWQGLEKLNLNGEHNDPTVSRSKVCWDLLRQMGVPAPRSNHVRLYINGQFRGLYINVEHIDEEFAELRFGNKTGNLYKCLYPADMTYLGSNPNAYKFMAGNRRAYALGTNEAADDYSDLAHLIDVLNNTPINDLPCTLEQVFNMETFIPAMVFDVLSGNWDGPLYNKNNFYLYHNQASGKFEFIPYDLDNTLGIDWLNVDWGARNIYSWSPSGQMRPLYQRILQVPVYRAWYSYYVNLFLQTIFNENALFPYIDALETRIAPAAQADPYRPLDYGFTFEDFETSFETELPFFQTPYGLKEYITARRNSALGQLQLTDIVPIIVGIQNNHPNENQEIAIQAKLSEDGAVIQAEVCYQLNGGGPISCFPLFDDGLHGDGAAGDGIYGAILPPLGQAALMEYYIRAIDNAGQESRRPTCGFRQLSIGSAAVPLAINEIMADNTLTIADEAGQYDDWIEIYNYGTGPVYLGDRYLSDDVTNPTRWRFPDRWIQPGEYLLAWTDDDESQGDLHTNFKLSAGGEFIGIFDDEANDHRLIDGFDFGEQAADHAYGRWPNGIGPLQVLPPTPGASNVAPTAIDESTAEDLIWQAYPNPFTDQLKVEWSSALPTPAVVQMFDLLGRKVAETVVAPQSQTVILDTHHLPGSYYTVVICFTDGQKIQLGQAVIKQ